MGWILTKARHNTNHYWLESTITNIILKEGTKQEIISYMKKHLIKNAKSAIRNGGVLIKGGAISYLGIGAKQNISIKTYVDSTIKDFFHNVYS